MIYIISTESMEYSTERVMDWMDAFKVPIIRINGENLSKKDNLFISISNNNLDIKIDNVSYGDESVAWYRRWNKKPLLPEDVQSNLGHSNLDSLKSAVSRDRNILKNFFLQNLNVQEWLTDPLLGSMNKLNVLTKASNFGLEIPSTLICTSKHQLLPFFLRYKRLIVKAVSEVVGLRDDDYNYSFLTQEINSKKLSDIPSEFIPTCFQELIEKKYEVRVFYLEGEIYSMAIFSQNDNTTELDFRNYNSLKPNRNVPYNLPEDIKLKLVMLMKDIGLNTGSIDLIKDINDNYIFLEINPVGQFGMVSTPCNYNLEKKIAEYLIKLENKHCKTKSKNCIDVKNKL